MNCGFAALTGGTSRKRGLSRLSGGWFLTQGKFGGVRWGLTWGAKRLLRYTGRVSEVDQMLVKEAFGD
jgi:hypothetical protein